MQTKAKILIVDDDTALLESCTRILKGNNGYNVVAIDNADDAVREIDTLSYDLIISDLELNGKSGLDLLTHAQSTTPQTPFLIFTAYGSVERAVDAMRGGAFDFIEKPFKAQRLRVAVEKSLDHGTLRREKRALEDQLQDTYGLGNITGKSQAMQRVFSMIRRVADGDTNVAITGESGTGKELVARSIHLHSGRKNKPFVPVNCGAFPEHLFESELFGYEKGAFTGAYRRKPGLLEYANNGTFFLDEVCELGASSQVKLLRMLQDRKIRRVGGTELIDVDVRIISASNQNLMQAVQNSILREDLYYRLNVITIELPPLRARKEDIPLLCKQFVQKFAKTTPKVIKGVSEEALLYLEGYSWPGNVRELENVIERAITLATTEWLRLEDLPEHICGGHGDLARIQLDKPLKDAKAEIIARFEREYLSKMLNRHAGNITRAATDSGIDRRTFHRLLNKHGLLGRSWKSTN